MAADRAAGVDKLHWTVSARASDGRSSDRIAVDEQVVPAVPEEVWGATYLRIGNGASVPVAPPAGALPGRGGIELALAASPAPPLNGVRAYMIAYPFGCFEQRLSKAVALDDRKAWDQQVGDLPTYMAPNGLLRYWPSDNDPGSIALTAYALSITGEAGLPWPDAARAKLIDAMKVGRRRPAERGRARGRTTPACCASPRSPRSPATARRRPPCSVRRRSRSATCRR